MSPPTFKNSAHGLRVKMGPHSTTVQKVELVPKKTPLLEVLNMEYKKWSLAIAAVLLVLNFFLHLIKRMPLDHIATFCSMKGNRTATEDCIDIKIFGLCTIMAFQAAVCLFLVLSLEAFDETFNRLFKNGHLAPKPTGQSLRVAYIAIVELALAMFCAVNVSTICAQLQGNWEEGHTCLALQAYNMTAGINGTAPEMNCGIPCLKVLSEGNPFVVVYFLELFIFVLMFANSAFNLLFCLLELLDINLARFCPGPLGAEKEKDEGFIQDGKRKGFDVV